MAAQVAGTVRSLYRWPVKSIGGESLTTVEVGRVGVAGDRAHILYHLHRGQRRQLTARQAPRLLAWRASYGDWDGPGVETPTADLVAPDGRRFGWEDPTLGPALSGDLGREVELRFNTHGEPDLRWSVLITTRATHEAVERELGRRLDPRRWRTNVEVDLDAEAFAEEGWEGRTLRIGEATFTLLHACKRCVIPTRDPDTQERAADLLKHLTREHGGRFGVNARADGPARLRAGDPVALSPPVPQASS